MVAPFSDEYSHKYNVHQDIHALFTAAVRKAYRTWSRTWANNYRYHLYLNLELINSEAGMVVNSFICVVKERLEGWIIL